MPSESRHGALPISRLLFLIFFCMTLSDWVDWETFFFDFSVPDKFWLERTKKRDSWAFMFRMILNLFLFADNESKSNIRPIYKWISIPFPLLRLLSFTKHRILYFLMILFTSSSCNYFSVYNPNKTFIDNLLTPSNDSNLSLSFPSGKPPETSRARFKVHNQTAV